MSIKRQNILVAKTLNSFTITYRYLSDSFIPNDLCNALPFQSTDTLLFHNDSEIILCP